MNMNTIGYQEREREREEGKGEGREDNMEKWYSYLLVMCSSPTEKVCWEEIFRGRMEKIRDENNASLHKNLV